VIVTDIDDEKLALAGRLGAVTPVNVRSRDLSEAVSIETDRWGADILFECSGNEKAAADVFDPLRPGGCVVYVGIPLGPIAYDVAKAQVKEARVEHVFRYAHVFPRCIAMLASGSIDVSSLITCTFPFAKSVEAFEYAASAPKGEVKIQISMQDEA
jgi:D-xylulose reductase